MDSNSVILVDEQQKDIFPITITDNVLDRNNVALSTTLDNINSNIANKSDKDASNITVASYQTKLNNMAQAGAGQTKRGQAVVVESYLSSDGLSWYRLWSDGWKECGGIVLKTSGGRTYVDVTFPNITFSTTNYTINGTYNEGPSASGTSTTGYYGYVCRKTVNSVRISVYGGANVDTSWYACGY